MRLFGRISRSSRADTCTASVYGAFVEAHIFLLFTRPLCATTGAMVVGCRKMFGVRLWSTGFWNILGDDFWYSFLTLRFLGRQWIHVGFSQRGFWKHFTRFLRGGVQFLVRFLSCPLLRTTCAGWSRQCRIAWRCRRCSSCAVLDVAVFVQRQVPGSPGTGFRSVHRQVRDGLNWAFLLHF